MLSSLGRIAVFLTKPRRLALACTATKMCLLQKRERLRTHAQPHKHDILRVLEPLLLFSVIYYQPFILPDSFNPVNKPDQTKATCHNNHVPVNVQTRLRPQYCFAWSASVFRQKHLKITIMSTALSLTVIISGC